ncbi:cytochrome P450, partial [Sphingobium fuliginis]|uniref:cytochrome P450 n=1 Tax=Sphingobium fuliginis (strain ATCC 27551) TaxID=336203 RepID=UPI00130431E0
MAWFYAAEWPTFAPPLTSIIANAKIGDEYITHRQMMGYYIIAATAGHDTTANTTSAAMWALAQNPEVFAQLKSDPGAKTGFIEESIRWATPVKH